jgi:Protein of unknown function (DUF3017)
VTGPGQIRGGGRRLLVHVPFLLVMAVVAVGVGLIVLYYWRRGTTLIGAALLLAAVFRLVLPDERAGLIVVRKRTVDVLVYTVFGLMVLYVSLSIEGGPLH